jgi:hypothetical protein
VDLKYHEDYIFYQSGSCASWRGVRHHLKQLRQRQGTLYISDRAVDCSIGAFSITDTLQSEVTLSSRADQHISAPGFAQLLDKPAGIAALVG